MAEIRCPSCGKDNPDFLTACQFCQTSLAPDPTLQIGQKPTKKNTGELENILPDWLKDVRKQSRDLAEEDAVQAASLPKTPKDEPPDLLAGLAFQSDSGDEEQVPDWLSSISPAAKDKPSIPSTPAEPEPDFFARFNKTESPPKSEPARENVPFFTEQSEGQAQDSPERDELSDWLTQASEKPVELSSLDSDVSQIDSGWGLNLDASSTPEREPAPQQQEDLSWLRNLEASSKQTDELSAPKQDEDWLSGFGSPSAPAPSSGQDDLSWLNNLGGTPAPEQPAEQSFQPKEDLDWLGNLGGVPAPEDAVQQPSQQPQEDLDWLNTLGGTPASGQSAQQSSQPREDLSWLNALGESSEPAQAASVEPVPAQDDLSWLNKLAGTSSPSQSFDFAEEKPLEQSSAQDDLSWLNELGGSPESLSAEPFSDLSIEPDKPKNVEEQEDAKRVSPFTPSRTAPLGSEEEASMPDWLKSAAEGPSMPVGTDELDQFREDFKIPAASEEPFSWKSFVPEARQADEEPVPSHAEAASVDSFTPAPDTSALSNQDVDWLFSMDMPDWLSRSEPVGSESITQETAVNAEEGEALTPVDLPSWVQAMRPVEAIISETAPSIEDQPAEREGPLAGFKGVIPAALIGSSRRPRPVSLTLQASNEQQTSVAILEQILASETSPRAFVAPASIVPQQMLRRAIAVLVLVVLGIMIFTRSQLMPISPLLPPAARDVTNVVMNIPDFAPVLVVLDYEPALAGEMEAVSGPLLDQLVMLRHPYMSFLTTSPNSTALVERLLVNTKINQPDGQGYRAGENYINMGYLPGGESGVLGFIQAPSTAIPSSPVLGFSEYAAIILLTDHADSARVWVEQLHILKQADSSLDAQPLLVVSSVQAGPMLQPYIASHQIDGLISGLSDAVRYEFLNNSRPGIARSYWDTFGVGLMLAISLIVLGSLWGLLMGIRSRRAEAAEG